MEWFATSLPATNPRSEVIRDASPAVPASVVVLVSGAAAMMGHGHRYLIRLARGLTDAGWTVHLVIPRTNSEQIQVGNATIHVIDIDYANLNADRFRKFGPLSGTARGALRWWYGRRLFSGLVADILPSMPASAEAPLAVHILDYEYLTLTAFLARMATRRDVRTYVTVHPSDFGPPRPTVGGVYKSLARQALRRVLSRVDGVVCHGDWIAERLVRQLALRPHQLHSIYYPSDAQDLRIDRPSARRRLGIPPDVPTTLWFGMIRRNKRVEVALEVLAQLPDEHHLIIAGHPAEIDPRALITTIHRLGLQKRVHFFSGYVPEEEIPTYFSAADVLLATHAPSFTSASGPIGDARSYRLPVVCGDAGQLGDYVRRFEVGVVASEDTVSAFAAALLAAHARQAKPDERSRWEAHIGQIANDLSWEAFSHAHATMYAGELPGP